jgi:hypothetical protein
MSDIGIKGECWALGNLKFYYIEDRTSVSRGDLEPIKFTPKDTDFM